MKNRSHLFGLAAAVGMVVLILDTETAVAGASDGIGTCIRTVIPSLFPFLLLSCWLNDMLAGERIYMPDCITKVAGLPSGGAPILLSAVLGGYPAGAQAVYRAYSNGSLDKKTAERMLAYTNNAGPAFIFGMAANMFPGRAAPWMLWGIHILSAFLVRLVFGAQEGYPNAAKTAAHKRNDTVWTVAKVMCGICIWVTVFRIVLSYLEIWPGPYLSPVMKVILTGALELVNGCCSLIKITDIDARFICCSGALAFGGICVMMQTSFVTQELKMRWYIWGKLLQTLFSLILSAAFVYNRWYLAVLIVPVSALLSAFLKNKGRNTAPIRV